jgi:hypothetical protein
MPICIVVLISYILCVGFVFGTDDVILDHNRHYSRILNGDAAKIGSGRVAISHICLAACKNTYIYKYALNFRWIHRHIINKIRDKHYMYINGRISTYVNIERLHNDRLYVIIEMIALVFVFACTLYSGALVQ